MIRAGDVLLMTRVEILVLLPSSMAPHGRVR